MVQLTLLLKSSRGYVPVLVGTEQESLLWNEAGLSLVLVCQLIVEPVAIAQLQPDGRLHHRNVRRRLWHRHPILIFLPAGVEGLFAFDDIHGSEADADRVENLLRVHKTINGTIAQLDVLVHTLGI